MRVISLSILWLFFAATLLAQDPPKEKEVDDDDVNNNMQYLIENLVEDSGGEDFDFETQFEYLEEYRKRPLDINSASEEDLVEFGLFTAIQIQSLLLYRKRFGQIFSLYELQGVPTFDVKMIMQLSPYITVAATKDFEKMNFGKMFKYSRHQIFTRYQRILETQKGYTPLQDGQTGSRYLGTPDKFYLRYRMTYKDRMSIGVTMENDAGEEFFKGSNPQGFDFYSGHIYLKKITKNIHSVALGDFQVYFGQGLTAWGGFGFRKGAQVLNIKRNSVPIRPFTSANEALFMRGAAGHFQFLKDNSLEVTVFGSYRLRDANLKERLDSLFNDNDYEVSSLQEFGYHRTPTEVANKNTVQLVTSGARVRYTGATWHIAGNFVHNYLSVPLNKTGGLYQKYQFSGNQTINASIDYSFRYRNIQFFGETAINEQGGIATVNSILADLDPRISLGVLHRYYDRKYNTLNGNGFAEGSSPSNESGFYIGAETRLGAGFKLSTYFDVFQFPWLKFQINSPSRGYEVFSKLDYSPSYYINLYIQYKFEQKDEKLAGSTAVIDEMTLRDKHNLRFHFAYDVTKEFSLRSRLEFSFYKNKELNQGFVIYQDLIFKPKLIPLKAQVRLAFFDAKNYDTRIYAYESDVLYAFSVVPYYGQGLRYYINLSYTVNRHLSIWLRFSQTYFTDRDVISSGLGEINGRTRSEIKVQVRAKF